MLTAQAKNFPVLLNFNTKQPSSPLSTSVKKVLGNLQISFSKTTKAGFTFSLSPSIDLSSDFEFPFSSKIEALFSFSNGVFDLNVSTTVSGDVISLTVTYNVEGYLFLFPRHHSNAGHELLMSFPGLYSWSRSFLPVFVVPFAPFIFKKAQAILCQPLE